MIEEEPGYTVGDDEHCAICGIEVEADRPASRWFFTRPGDRNSYYHTICFGDCIMQLVEEAIIKRHLWAEREGLIGMRYPAQPKENKT